MAIEIIALSPDSPLRRFGVRTGMKIKQINGYEAVDFLDILYVDEDAEIELEVEGLGKIQVRKDESESLGVEVEPLRIRQCRNRCVFCFVSQMPRGLRPSLYVKDEDYRLSFIEGSFITMTSLTNDDLERIVRLNLSPLYISVHAVTPKVRQELLKPIKVDNFLKNFKYLSERGIRFHTQIVLTPGFNDGEELEKTIDYLLSFDNVDSIAVVPVGLTKFRRHLPKIKQVDKEIARKAIAVIERKRKEFGRDIIYAADELFIKAALPIPPLEYYNEFPQFENGVGMVRDFIDGVMAYAEEVYGKRFPQLTAFLTGADFAPFLSQLLAELNIGNVKVHPVQNDFFGKSVTVTGLLTAQDIWKTVAQIAGEQFVVPDIIFSRADVGPVTLDNITPEELLKKGVKTVSATPEGFVDFLKSV